MDYEIQMFFYLVAGGALGWFVRDLQSMKQISENTAAMVAANVAMTSAASRAAAAEAKVVEYRDVLKMMGADVIE